MIDYKLHKNGWTILVDKFNFKTAGQEDINDIAKLIANNTCVVFKNQSLSVDDELRVAKMFKNPKPLFKSKEEENYKNWAVDEEGIIARVTGELNERGKPGIAGHSEEMVWHCNMPQDRERAPIIWLYAARGSKGSRTSWNNNILSYNDLDSATKEKLKQLKCIYMGGAIVDESGQNSNQDYTPTAVEEFQPSLVYTNNAGKTGLYLSYLQLESFVGMSREESLELITPIWEHTIQDKYCYHHDWEDGDVVIAEQWLGVHRRWPFDNIEDRLLHRIAFDFPDQDYS
jgi:alpha-ketoglutarate-dependent taurine dioxygenase